MQTQFKNTPWGRRYSTAIPLIFRIENGELQILGLYEDRESAEREINTNSKANKGWQIADVSCWGWGIIGDKVEGRHSPIAEPREVSREEEAEYMKNLYQAMQAAGFKVET